MITNVPLLRRKGAGDERQTLFVRLEALLCERPAVFFGVLAAVVALKIWLTSEIHIVAVYAPHDAFNFVVHAKSVLEGHWFGKYDDLTLIKGPAFPLYLAAVHWLGLSLPLAHQLLYAIASLTACIAAAPLIRGRVAQLLLFVVVLFYPYSFGNIAWVANRSQITESLALLAVSCAVAIFLRRRDPLQRLTPWFIGLGVAFAAFWLTREEGVWLAPALVMLMAAYVWGARRGGQPELVRRGAMLAIPIGLWACAIVLISTINLAVYGWFTTIEVQSPEFVSAYNSLARIVAPPRVFVPITKEARAIAYGVSPAAAELKPGLEGGPGASWAGYGCNALQICGDIGAGWFMWALRDSVAFAGHYSRGDDSRAFYVRLAAELDAACDAGRIRCREKGHTLVPPIALGDVPVIFADFVRLMRIAGTFSNFDLGGGAAPQADAVTVETYAFVTRDIAFPGAPADVTFDDGFKRAVMYMIGGFYQLVLPFALTITLLLAGFRMLRALRTRSLRAGEHAYLAVCVLVSGCALLAILAIIDAVAFPAFNPEYTAGLLPILVFTVACALIVETRVVRRFVRSHSVGRPRLIAASAIVAIVAFGGAAFLERREPAPQAVAAVPATAVPAPSTPVRAGRPFACTRVLQRAGGVAHGALDGVQKDAEASILPRPMPVTRGSVLVLRGWAADAGVKHPLAGVCPQLDGKTLPADVLYGAKRPDVAHAFNHSGAADTGYEIRVSTAGIAPGAHTLEVVGVDRRGRAQVVGVPELLTIR